MFATNPVSFLLYLRHEKKLQHFSLVFLWAAFFQGQQPFAATLGLFGSSFVCFIIQILCQFEICSENLLKISSHKYNWATQTQHGVKNENGKNKQKLAGENLGQKTIFWEFCLEGKKLQQKKSSKKNFQRIEILSENNVKLKPKKNCRKKTQKS